MITGVFAGILGLMYFRFSLATINARKKNQVSLGTGSNDVMEKFYSAHNNANNYIPLFLILLFLYEKSAHSFFYITIVIGVLFCIGRLLHFKAITAEKMNFKNRVRGMKLTLLPILILSILNIGVFIYGIIRSVS